jgi:hypothetical protein
MKIVVCPKPKNCRFIENTSALAILQISQYDITAFSTPSILPMGWRYRRFENLKKK